MKTVVAAVWMVLAPQAWAQPEPSRQWLVHQAFVLGLDDAVTAPNEVLRQDPMRWTTQAEMARSTGVQVVRVNSHTGPRLYQVLSSEEEPDWLMVEAYFAALREAGLAAVVVLAPWPGVHPEALVDSCNIADPQRYHERVAELVGRVGDGVLAWELDNEPDLAFSREPGWCPPTYWAHFARLTVAAVRSVRPDATLLLGGLYRPHTDAALAWWSEVGGSGLDHRWLDGVAVHLYPAPETLEDQVRVSLAQAEAVFGLPVWVTEASTTGLRGGRGRRGEAEQARALVQLVLTARLAGARALFWHALADAPGRGGEVPARGWLRVEARQGRPPVAVRYGAKPALEAAQVLATVVPGALERDGGLAWVPTREGWLVYAEAEEGIGVPPGPLVPIAGGEARPTKDGRWRLRGLATVRGRPEPAHPLP